jgi:hypothetical protein
MWRMTNFERERGKREGVILNQYSEHFVLKKKIGAVTLF